MADASTILVVEDSPEALRTLVHLLSAGGLLVHTAENGTQALAHAMASPPDLILLDVRMPGMDGFEVLRRLKAEEITRPIPVLLISGLSEPEERTRGLELGAMDFIGKPFHKAELMARIRTHLELGRLRREWALLMDEQAHELTLANEQLRAEVARQKEAETVLLRSEERFALAFHASPDAITISRLSDGVYLLVNEGFTRILGIPAASAVGKSATHLGIWSDIADRDRWAAELQERGQVSNLEVAFLRPDGKVVLASVSSRTVTWEGELVQLSISRDITDLKRSEQERHLLQLEVEHLQKLESLGSLAGGIAHDMNNVLAAIQAVTESLRMHHAADRTLAQSLGIIEKASTRGRDLVKGLTNFARKDLHEAENLNLNTLVREEMALLGRTTLQRVNLVMDLEEALPAVRGERGTLANVLMNLCVNAIDAMPEGGDLTLRTRSLPDSQVELQVVDNGRGMPPSVLARAMEPFFTTKPLGKGTGLGLALAYATAKAHGGNLSLQSEAGQGSTVTLRLPSVAGATQAEAEPEPAQVSAAATRILLVDDDELILVAIPAMIETLGHHVTVAAGGPEALALLEAPEPFDLVILDLNMPGMNGVETFERIRHGWPNLPVLIATGYLDSATTYLLQKAGLALSISKPYSLRELDQRIQELRNLPVR